MCARFDVWNQFHCFHFKAETLLVDSLSHHCASSFMQRSHHATPSLPLSCTDIGADAVKTGMLPTAAAVALVAAKMKEYKAS